MVNRLRALPRSVLKFRAVSRFASDIVAGTGIGITGTTTKTISNTGVVSFNGRVGSVIPENGDYTIAMVPSLQAALDSKANRAATSTDNSIARHDGTGGALQNSGVTIDDSNNIAGAVNLSSTGYHEITEISSPSNPVANKLRVFAKDVSGATHLFYRDSSGNEVDLSGGTTEIDVFLIGGQSNAVGQGSSASSPTVPTGKVLQYKASAATISDANDPVGDGANAANTGSAWPSFGNAYYYGTGRAICFVPSAVSGSAQVAANDGGSGNWDTSGALRGTAVTNVTNAMAALTAVGYSPIFKGVLWSQGETDAASAANYQTALTTMIAFFRSTYGASMPFYIFRTGTITTGDTAGYQTVRAAQEAVAAASPHTHIVFWNAYDFVGRSLMADTVHYNQTGLIEMGRLGAANVIARNGYGGPLRISETNGLFFGGFPSLSRGSNFNILSDGAGNNSILLGSAADPKNYHRQTTHTFQSIAGSTTFANINSSGVGLRSTGAAFDLILARPSTAFTANRTLTFSQGDASRTVTLNGDVAFGNAFTTSGNFAVTQTYTGTTNVTFPTTGTLQNVAIHMFHSTGTLAAGATSYFSFFNGGSESAVSTVLGAACTVTTLYVKSTAAPAVGQTFTYTLQKNGADTAITCQISGAATSANDTAHSVAYAAGDTISVKCVTSAGAAVTFHAAGIKVANA